MYWPTSESGEGVDSTIAAVAAVAAVAKYSGPSEASSVKAKKSLSKSKPSQGEGYSKRTCSVNKNNYTNSNMARKCVNGQVESKAETTPSGVRVVTSRNAQARAVNVVRSRTPQACSTCSSNDAVSKTNTNGENSIQADKPATHATHGEVLRRGKVCDCNAQHLISFFFVTGLRSIYTEAYCGAAASVAGCLPGSVNVQCFCMIFLF